MAQIQTISDTHRSYDPMAYPLFYPFGTDGWSLRYITSVPKLTLQKYLGDPVIEAGRMTAFPEFSISLFLSESVNPQYKSALIVD